MASDHCYVVLIVGFRSWLWHNRAFLLAYLAKSVTQLQVSDMSILSEPAKRSWLAFIFVFTIWVIASGKQGTDPPPEE